MPPLTIIGLLNVVTAITAVMRTKKERGTKEVAKLENDLEVQTNRIESVPEQADLGAESRLAAENDLGAEDDLITEIDLWL